MSIVRRGAEGNVGETSSMRRRTPLVQLVALRPTAASQVCSLPFHRSLWSVLSVWIQFVLFSLSCSLI